MVNYVRAECYKVLHRKYTYIFLGVLFLMELFLVGAYMYANHIGAEIGSSNAIQMLAMMLSAGLYCALIPGDIVFSEQYKVSTLKNEVSIGLPRTRIYLGKLLVSCVTAIVLCALILAFYLGLCFLLLPSTPDDLDSLKLVGYCLLVALPLWLGMLALVNLSFFLLKSSTVASFAVVGVIIALPQLVQLLGALVSPVFHEVYNVLLTTPLDLAPNKVGDWGFVASAYAIGAGWFLLATLGGLVAFRKREIN